MTIQKATGAQAGVIAALAKEIWTEHYTPIIGSAQVQYMIDRFQSETAVAAQMATGGYTYYLAYCGGEAAGYCGVQWQADREALFLSKLYVAARHRRKGLSRALLNQALSDYPALKSVYLTVNKKNLGSIAAYRAMGFIISDEVVSDIGNGFVMDDYVMTLM